MTIFKKTLTVLTAILAMVGAVTTTALATTGHGGHRHPSPAGAPVLTGSWATNVTLTDAPPTVAPSFQALDTFTADGGLVASSSQAMPSTPGLAHGSWSHADHRNYTSSFTWFRFDSSGQYAGTQTVQRTMKVSDDGTSFTSADVISIIAPTGAILGTFHGTETGHKLPG